jgi:class 3 adenylate cyclase
MPQATGHDAGPEEPRSRWSTRARALFLAAIAAWLVCFALAARASLSEAAYPPVFIRLDRDVAFPIVDGHRLGGARGRELRAGDVLLRWGAASLLGASDIRFCEAVYRHTPPDHRAEVVVRRDGQVQTLRVTTGSYRLFWPRLPAAIIFLLTAAVFVFRSPANPLTRSIVAMLLGWAFLFVCTFVGSIWLNRLATAVQVVSVSLVAVAGLRTALVFPHAILPDSGWLRGLPYVFAVLGPLDIERLEGAWLPREAAHRLCFALYAVLLVAHLVIATLNYRRASAIERRKIKWLVWAVLISSSVSVLAALVAIVQPALSLQYYVALSSVVLIPLALLISITRFNLFDIDRILSATAWYSLLIGSGLVLLLAGAPRVARAASATLGVDEDIVQIAVACVFAVAGVVLSRWLYPKVDAALFVERAALQKGVVRLLSELHRSESRPGALELVGRELHGLLRPETLAIYVRGENSWAPAFVRGPAIAPAIPGNARVLALLEAAPSALSFEVGRARGKDVLHGLDRSLVEALDARVVLPVRQGGRLAAAVFIGPKGSGDVFVRSDLALLGSIGHALSERMQHLQEQALRSDTEEQLRSYVPGPLVSQIVRGQAIEDGEREVTLMFVDIRGYSAYAENRAPAEVFAMVTRYTQCVSQVVQRHHGTVVEFNGDGMMAVFGAPEPLANREFVAVRAALDLAAEVRSVVPLAVSTRSGSPVGIGIATGRAFVGNIRSSDRQIWTALGASTNRAARLQTMTRDFDTDLVVDESTWRALGALQREFVLRANITLRGHSRRVNLYVHALAEPAVDALPQRVSA